jgi:hypothetical protein
MTDEPETPDTDEEEEQEKEQPESNDWTGPHRQPGLGY